MLLALLAFVASAILLYLSSETLLSHLFRRLPLNLVFFLLLPGVFLHEFSHLLMGELLRVRTGNLKLKPEIKDGHLTMGSAEIALVDPFRLTLVGVAPFIAGTAALWFLIQLGLGEILWYWKLAAAYLIFAIANSLFSSRSDLQYAAVPLILVIILVGTFTLAHLSLPPALIPWLTDFFFNLTRVFAYTLAVNLLLLLPLWLISARLK